MAVLPKISQLRGGAVLASDFGRGQLVRVAPYAERGAVGDARRGAGRAGAEDAHVLPAATAAMLWGQHLLVLGTRQMTLQAFVRAIVHPRRLPFQLAKIRFQVFQRHNLARRKQHALWTAENAALARRPRRRSGAGSREDAQAPVSLPAAASLHTCGGGRGVALTQGAPTARCSSCWPPTPNRRRSSGLARLSRLRDGVRSSSLGGFCFLCKQGRLWRLVEVVVTSQDFRKTLGGEGLHAISGLLVHCLVQAVELHQSCCQQLAKTTVLAHDVQPRRRTPDAVSLVLALGRRARLPRVEAAGDGGAVSFRKASAAARAHGAWKEKQIEIV